MALVELENVTKRFGPARSPATDGLSFTVESGRILALLGPSGCGKTTTLRLIAGFDPRPWEELAKLHEHRRRDFVTARAVVEDALGLAEAAGAPVRTVDAFTHRLGRLERRATIAAGRPSEPRE